jgi:Asp-tRNA(Asn)/Glu-tRNA(Gln) amidotransferase A subunit family amidase
LPPPLPPPRRDSSGGTAAAVAANFGAAGLGTDTGNSIRGPASHTSLVGIRSTMGLTSRDGIVPLFLDKDVGGPMARTVADAVAIFAWRDRLSCGRHRCRHRLCQQSNGRRPGRMPTCLAG